MPHFKEVLLAMVLCLIAFVWTGTIASPLGLNSQQPQSASRLIHIVEDVAQGLGYRSMRGTRIPDQWSEGERQGWALGGRDTEKRMHRFVGFIGGSRPRTADGLDERSELRNTWCRAKS
jgi:hypothetical protein